MQAMGRTHRGQRNNNEDYFIVDLNENIYAVADGMGGHNAGEIASCLAIKTIEEILRGKSHTKDPIKEMRFAIQEANTRINSQSQIKADQRGMGTTLTLLWLVNDRAYIANVGDSRAYLIHNKKIELITSDHTLVQELVKNGDITKSEAMIHPKRNILTRAVGTQISVEVDFIDISLQKKDVILLCTDGLSNKVSEKRIEEIIINSKSIEEGCYNLINEAIALGGEDNITSVLIYKD